MQLFVPGFARACLGLCWLGLVACQARVLDPIVPQDKQAPDWHAASAQTPALAGGAPVEVGRVAWLRDLDQGLALAKARSQPVLLLFQEVPG